MEKFLGKVKKGLPNECWPWEGTTNNGYGQVTMPGRQVAAHRLSYQAWIGPIPEGLDIHHVCHNKLCVNPAHLEALPHKDHTRQHLTNPLTQNFLKTHCLRGHELSGYNVYVINGSRNCRECNNRRNRESYARKKAVNQGPTG